MHWISIIFIGLASNIDNLGIGVSYGTRSTKISLLSNLFIAVLAMAAAYVSITMGQFISGYMTQQRADLIGGTVIILLGLWSIFPKKITTVVTRPLPSSSDYNTVLSWKESLSLGIALSFNCMATGFGAGVSGASPMITAISVGVFSLLTVALGTRIGHHIAKTWLGRYSTLIGGLILIVIGLFEVF